MPCSSVHLIEVAAGASQVTGLGDTWPGDAALAGDSLRQCTGPVQAFLGHPIDPYGRFTVGAIFPTQGGWVNGDRTLWCGVQAAGSAAGIAVPFTGDAKGADQTLLLPIGSCLPPGVIKSVPCTQAHAVEITGNVTLPVSVTSLPSSSSAWQSLIGASCQGDGATYLGGSYPPGVTSGWLPIGAASWTAGRRTAQCVVGQSGPNGFAEINHSLRP